MGLALCRSIVLAHEGTIILRDNEPHGAVFTFSLPLSEVKPHE
jgi:two-component system sensor histidine kinase KdpD